MSYVNFKVDIDGDGIALVTWDVPDRSMNVISLAGIEELAAVVEQLAVDAAVKGVVITSGKETFCAGADLTLTGPWPAYNFVAAGEPAEAAKRRKS